MFRNQYDTDVTVWSPEGRLLQVEYAMESVKQGSACVGVRSSKVCVLAALKRSVSELSSHQKKVMVVDDHIACGIAGLTADARSLVKYMQKECLTHKYVYGIPMPPHRLMADLADKHQLTTQTYVRRPFGVGLLIATVDSNSTMSSSLTSMENGGEPHLYQTCPSGNLYEFYASAIGARSQSARTYLEKHYKSFPECSTDDLIVHALQALVGSVSGDNELTTENASVAIVAPGQKVQILEGTDLTTYLSKLEVKTDDDDDDDDNNDDEGGDDAAAAAAEGGEAKEGEEPQAMET